jgi:hypothetical protein
MLVQRIILIALILLNCGTCYAGDSEMVTSLESKVEKFRSFFNTYQHFIEKQQDKSSPTGYIFIPGYITAWSINYDAVKTDSIVSPYKGFIEYKFKSYTDRTTGDVKSAFTGNSYSTESGAISALDNIFNMKENNSGIVKLEFHGKNGRWVLANITGNNGLAEATFGGVFDMNIKGRLHVDYNQKWIALIE